MNYLNLLIRILPNSEQLTSVASSINLAKSYVTFLSCIADSIAEIIKSAASVQPRCLSIISAERISDPGLTLSCPAYFGAPKYAGQDKVNPGSLILSAEMMLRHLGWTEAADLIISAMESAIQDKKVTYDFARLIDDATEVSCSEFGKILISKFK